MERQGKDFGEDYIRGIAKRALIRFIIWLVIVFAPVSFLYQIDWAPKTAIGGFIVVFIYLLYVMVTYAFVMGPAFEE